MPTCRRKRVMLKELTASLLEDAKNDPSTPVFYMEQTGEIFADYESYAARLSFYKLKQFQCEVTGKSGLDYFQALESEQQEARTLHARFPQPLKAPVLRAVQWQVVGRLDHLVEAVYDRFKDRYFEGERVYVDIQGDRYWARVVKVFPPRSQRTRASSSTSDSVQPPSDDETEPHRISGDLKIPVAQLNSTDDPKGYYYKVQLIEEGVGTDMEYPESKGKGKSAPKWSSSLMEVQCEAMSRDRLSFSKSILRRFIRDCVDRDAAVASPWTVKKSIAEKYGVENIMPEETRKGVEEVKNKEIEKRKKVWEDKEGPPTKKQKKMEERGKLGNDPALKAKEEEQRMKEEAAQVVELPPLPKKKYVKYPTEDLDVVLSQRERAKRIAANGHTRSVRPKPFTDLPFENRIFESLLMTWSFFTAFGTPLKLSSFTLDELESAIRHNDLDQPVTLIAEIHSSLIYALRALSTHRHSAVVSLLQEEDEIDPEGVTTAELTDALADIGNNWERQPLRVDEGRSGWEEAMIGCIKDQATVYTFPTLRGVLTRLLFTSDSPETSSSLPASPMSGTGILRRASPHDRYYLLPPEDKIGILAFLCDAVVSHKEIHLFMENCETNLTQLRKEKIEVKKERKKIETQDSKEVKPESEDPEQDILDLESELSEADSDPIPDSDGDGSDAETASGAENGRSRSIRQKDLRFKAANQAHSKQREIARAKTASAKQAQAEHRRLDEEDNKLERRMESIEREFRKWSGVVRLKPLGKDRFHNRYWWFDGIGNSALIASGGTVTYGAGRLFVQGPTIADVEVMERKQKEDDPSFDLLERRQDEEGPDGILGIGTWGYYTEPEQLVEIISWLNVKGNRELKLKDNLNKWADHISGGMRKRATDLTLNARLPEARRSTRKNAPEAGRHSEPYLLWQNRKAPTALS
ncbi:chromatin remodeling complex protein [Hysterangium stoloniferum]|nr:chromatin remodeling complex protein [Hysterangium stoloniferum]